MKRLSSFPSPVSSDTSSIVPVKRRRVCTTSTTLSSSSESLPSLSTTTSCNDFSLSRDKHASLDNPDKVSSLPLADLTEKRENPGAVVKALKQLHKMLDSKSNENWKIKKRLIFNDAPAAIVLIMQRWHKHREVLSSCCACLSRLAYKYDEGGSAIANSNGVEAIAKAMQAFPNSLHIQRFGCAALSNVLATHTTKPNILRALHKFVEEQDGLDLITQAMAVFKDDATLQARCCGLLSNIATRKDLHEALRNACVRAAVGSAIEYHWDDDKVQNQAAGFIKMLDR